MRRFIRIGFAILVLCAHAVMETSATASTPTAKTAATGEEVLFSHTFPAAALPTGDAQGFFYRLTLPPGVSLPLLAGPFCGCPGQSVTPGIGIEFVTVGAYTIRLDAAFMVARGGGVEQVAAGAAATLESGAAAIFPEYAAPGDIRNGGTTPTSIVGFALVSTTATTTPVPDLPQELESEELARLVSADWKRLPAGPVTVMLRRVTLPVGIALGPYEAAGFDAMSVIEGEIGVAFIPAGETEPSQPLVYGTARATPFVLTKPGTRRLVTNEGIGTTTVL